MSLTSLIQQLESGDLLFMWKDQCIGNTLCKIEGADHHHVGVYVGDGELVHVVASKRQDPDPRWPIARESLADAIRIEKIQQVSRRRPPKGSRSVIRDRALALERAARLGDLTFSWRDTMLVPAIVAGTAQTFGLGGHVLTITLVDIALAVRLGVLRQPPDIVRAPGDQESIVAWLNEHFPGSDPMPVTCSSMTWLCVPSSLQADIGPPSYWVPGQLDVTDADIEEAEPELLGRLNEMREAIGTLNLDNPGPELARKLEGLCRGSNIEPRGPVLEVALVMFLALFDHAIQQKLVGVPRDEVFAVILQELRDPDVRDRLVGMRDSGVYPELVTPGHLEKAPGLAAIASVWNAPKKAAQSSDASTLSTAP